MSIKPSLKVSYFESLNNFITNSEFSSEIFVSVYYLLNKVHNSGENIGRYNNKTLFSYLLKLFNNNDVNVEHPEYKLIDYYASLEDLEALYLFTGIPLEYSIKLPQLEANLEEHPDPDYSNPNSIEYFKYNDSVEIKNLSNFSREIYLNRVGVPDNLKHVLKGDYTKKWATKIPVEYLHHPFRERPISTEFFNSLLDSEENEKTIDSIENKATNITQYLFTSSL